MSDANALRVHGRLHEQKQGPDLVPGFLRVCSTTFLLTVGERHGLGRLRKGRPKGKNEGAAQAFAASAALPLTAIRLALDCALGDFGRLTVNTPFLNEASTWPSSTS